MLCGSAMASPRGEPRDDERNPAPTRLTNRRCRCGKVDPIDFYTNGNRMNLYMFEYLDEHRTRQHQSIRAIDTGDAFDAFRIEHPYAPISLVWVEVFGIK